jgi:2-keto-4-pentenoate hydratase/2-oxohepta-3-ene-1,7-dioic acid hydratase in catechol pathway
MGSGRGEDLMRYLSFRRPDGASSYGRLDGGVIEDLGAAAGAPPDLRSALAVGSLAGQSSVVRHRLAEVLRLPVIPNPSKILCVGHNYETHRQETGRAKVDYPSIFTRFADTLVAHEQPIIRPHVSTNLDYEGELAVVIGRTGRAIPESRALEHVAGYACFNDASIRDWQWHTSQFTPGKNFPGTAGLGPWLVTPDEAGDLSAVHVTTRLNGQVVQDQPIGDMIFPVAKIIAYISTFTVLSPGDVIATGTPGGVGAKRTPPLWMQAGDRIDVDIGPLGTLSNRVMDEA